MMHKMADGWKENDNRIKKISRKHKFPGYSETQSSMLLTSACHKERKSSSVYMFSNSSSYFCINYDVYKITKNYEKV